MKWAGRRISPEDAVKTVSRRIVYTEGTKRLCSIVERASRMRISISSKRHFYPTMLV